MAQGARTGSIITSLLLLSLLSACAGDDRVYGTQRAARGARASTVDFEALPTTLFPAPPTAVVDATWGNAEGEYQRAPATSQTGPMAIAAGPGGGVAVVDRGGSRVYRYAASGDLTAAIEVDVESTDDLVVLPNDRLVLLAYRRTPNPGYELLTYDRAGNLVLRLDAPRAATLPTALVSDGEGVLVEHRQEWLHRAGPAAGRRLQWGRSMGRLQARARLLDGEGVLLWTVDGRTGEPEWSLRIETPWPVTRLAALEVSDGGVALVVRHIVTDASSEPAAQETWLIVVSDAGEAQGRQRLVDSRITDSGQPFAMTASGNFYELSTDAQGVRVLRYDRVGNRS